MPASVHAPMVDGEDEPTRHQQPNKNVSTVEAWATGQANVRAFDVKGPMMLNLDAPPHVADSTVASVVGVPERRGLRKRGNKLGRAATTAASGAITSVYVSLACATLDNLTLT